MQHAGTIRYARRAIKRPVCTKLAIRCQFRKLQTSPQSIGAMNEKISFQMGNSNPRPIQSNDVLTEQVLDLVKRVLGPRKHAIWNSSVQRLEDGYGKKRRLGVLDLSNSDSSNLVNALVGGRDVSPTVREALESRWTSVPESTSGLVIRNGEKVARFGSILEVPSDILAKSNAEVFEVRDVEHAADLIRAHLPVIIIRPGIHPNIPSLKHKKDTIILFDYADSSGVGVAVDEPAQSGRPTRFMGFNSRDPHAALSRLYAILSAIEVDSSPKLIALCGMLDECSAELESTLHQLEGIKVRAAAFKAQVHLLLNQLEAKFQAIDLPAELQDNKTYLHDRMASFGRFRFWEIDDFGEELQAYVIASYGVNLERKLEWFAGSMAAAQERMHQLTNEYLDQLSHGLDSASLINQVKQLETSELPVPPSCFTAPILNRRRQLASIVTPYMQSRYLRRVYASMVAMPIAAGAPTLLWANGIMDPSFALPSAILGLLLCIRHISNAWIKGRTKWLADYDRIQTGLGEDIQRIVREMLERRLRAAPTTALEGSDRLVVQREATIKALVAAVEDCWARHRKIEVDRV